MKLIYCKECGDVVRLIMTKWRKCECGKSGGQYIENTPIATIGGECFVFGIANPFFNEVVQYLTEQGKQWWREKNGYGLPNTSDCWYGEFSGDREILRIKSPDGPALKVKRTISKVDKTITVIEIVDSRPYTANAKDVKFYSIKTEELNPSFKKKK